MPKKESFKPDPKTLGRKPPGGQKDGNYISYTGVREDSEMIELGKSYEKGKKKSDD